MKKKFLAILLGALLVASVLPVGSMAAAETNLIPNGDFEAEFATTIGETPVYDGVPTADWLTSLTIATDSARSQGTASRLATDTLGEKTIAPVTGDGGHFLKLHRTSANPSSDLLANTNRVTRIGYNLSNLKADTTYRLEFYVNIPVALPSGVEARVHFEIPKSSGTDYRGSTGLKDLEGNAWSLKSITGPTNNWEKKTIDFEFTDSRETLLNLVIYGAGEGVVYFDELKLYEYNPEAGESVLASGADGTFTSKDFAPFQYHSDAVEGTHYDFVADPEDDTNTVMKIYKNNGNVWKIPLAYDEAMAASKTGMYKISFRFRYIGPITFTGDKGLWAYCDVENVGRTNLSFRYNVADKWIDAEAYVNPATKEGEYYWFEQAGAGDYLIDDVEVAFIDGSFVSDLNVQFEKQTTRTAAGQKTAWTLAYTGQKGGSFTGTETVKPIIRYASTESAQKALAVAAVYKTNGTTRTLVDINIAEVASKDPATFTGGSTSFDRTQAGFASSSFTINLADLGLTAGNYEVEYFLWNYTGLAPIGTSAFAVNVAA